MSELSELIKINKNIEKQNEEIIRLLKKIAGEDENDEASRKGIVLDEALRGKILINEENIEDELVTPEPAQNEFIDKREELLKELLFDDSPSVGEVYFLNEDIFKYSVKDNEISIDNLTGQGECADYSLAELISDESVKNNQSLDDSTVIFTDSTKGNLPDALRLCIEGGAKKAYIPWNQMLELLSAPQELQVLIKLDFYKTTDQLIEKLFGKS